MKIVAALAISLSLWARAQAAVPVAPALQNPADNAVLQNVNLPLSWLAAPAAESYRIQVSTDADFSPAVVDDSGITQLYWNVGPLKNNTLYHWRVRAKNADGVGAWTVARAFTTLPAAPGAVTLATPANAAANMAVKPTLKWRTNHEADSYTLQVSAKSDFSTTVLSSGLLIDTAYAFATALDNGTTYYWRVLARNAAGPGPYSAVWNFSTLPEAPAVPAVIAPANDAAQLPLPIAFSWHKSNRAATYGLQISTVTDFHTLVLDTTRNDTTCSFAKLNYATTYYWRVRASNAGGNSAYTAVYSFSTLEKPAVPALASPGDFSLDLPNTGAKLVWHKSARGALYHVQVSAKADFSTLAANDSGADTTATLGALAYSAYFWRVEAKNAAGTSGFTAVWHFTTQPPAPASAPVLISPANAATGLGLSPALLWHKAAAATLYRIQVSTTSNFSALVDHDSTKTDTTISVGPLQNEQTYFWRVQAVNAGGEGDYSEVRSFTTKAGAVGAVNLVSPSDNAADLARNPTLVWKTASAASNYRVQISATADFAARVLDDSNVTDTTEDAGPLENGKTYYWRVRAQNSAGAGDYSAARKFTVIAAQPGAPVLNSPADGSKNLEATVILNWTPLANATGYRIEFSESPTFSSPQKDSVGKDTTLTLHSLTAGATYYWRVQAKNVGGNGPFSEIRAFTIKPVTGIQASRFSSGERMALTSGLSGTLLEFFVPGNETVAIDLIDPGTGRIHPLVHQAYSAGTYRISSPGLFPAAGVYALRLVSGSHREVKRVVIQ
jgi:hypothetical protein